MLRDDIIFRFIVYIAVIINRLNQQIFCDVSQCRGEALNKYNDP